MKKKILTLIFICSMITFHVEETKCLSGYNILSFTCNNVSRLIWSYRYYIALSLITTLYSKIVRKTTDILSSGSLSSEQMLNKLNGICRYLGMPIKDLDNPSSNYNLNLLNRNWKNHHNMEIKEREIENNIENGTLWKWSNSQLNRSASSSNLNNL